MSPIQALSFVMATAGSVLGFVCGFLAAREIYTSRAAAEREALEYRHKLELEQMLEPKG